MTVISFKQFLAEDYDEHPWDYPTKDSKWVLSQMKQKGYKILGKGADKAAFIDSSNNVIVIVGPIDENNHTRGELFIDWAKFCQKRKNNPYLPNIIGFTKFDAPNGANFIQIKMEKLFPVVKNLGAETEAVLDEIAELAKKSFGNLKKFQKFLDDFISDGKTWMNQKTKDTNSMGTGKVLMHISDFELFATTLFEIIKEGMKLGYTIDLHDANYMLSSDGELVIVDPWFGGW